VPDEDVFALTAAERLTPLPQALHLLRLPG